MAELLHFSPDNPEFPRVIEMARLRDQPSFAFDISPNPEEMDRIARLMGAQALRKLRLRGKLTALAKGSWQLDADLGATVIQTCVVTLDPVTTRIDQPVRRLLVPAQPVPRGVEIVVSAEEDEEIEPLTDRLDLGLVAIESLALALPPYPRKPGAELPDALFSPGDGPEEPSVKPFAALAALRDKLDGGS